MEGKASNQKGKGKEFRSMGETQVARLLDRVGIAYLYEHPVAVVDEGKVRIWYPDFQVPRYGILIEFFGVRDKPDYEAGIKRKLAVCESNGLAVLALRHDDFSGNWPDRVLSEVEGHLEHRLEEFRRKRVAAFAGRQRPEVVGSR